MRHSLPLVPTWLVAAGVALLAACTDPTGPANDLVDETPELRAAAEDPVPSQEAMSRAVPGFGGYFLDTQGHPVVYLKDPSRRGVAERALTRFFARRGVTASDLVVRRGNYDYAELAQWYRRARLAAFQLPGVFLGDIDESRNQLRFGVQGMAVPEMITAALAGLGIPADAFVIQSRVPFRTMATLRDRVRPLGGGLQINFFATPPSIPGIGYLCTLGFNADHDGVRSFITNSHCSNTEGGTVLPTDYYQAERSGGAADIIGVEVDDPAWSFSTDVNCPPPFQCRYSDAVRAEYAPGTETALGAVAMIDALTTGLEDTTHTIVGQFDITGERGEAVIGEQVDKVGRTTGWTRGAVTETCVDVLATGTNHIRLCQNVVQALVDGGDSGSPVFAQNGDGATITLLGILWGGSVQGTPEFVYSPITNIERELGALTTY